MTHLIIYVAIIFFCLPISAQYYPSDNIHEAGDMEKVPLQTLSNDAASSQLLMRDSASKDDSSCFKSEPCEKMQSVLRRIAHRFMELADRFYGFYGLGR